MFANIILSTRLTCCAPSWRYSRLLFILKEGTGSRLYVFPLGHSLDEAPDAPQHISTKTLREKKTQKSHITLTSHNSRSGETARPHLDSNCSSAPAGITWAHPSTPHVLHSCCSARDHHRVDHRHVETTAGKPTNSWDTKADTNRHPKVE